MASWIEMYFCGGASVLLLSRLMWPRGLKYHSFSVLPAQRMSRLMWPRGLKYTPQTALSNGERRGLCGLVD